MLDERFGLLAHILLQDELGGLEVKHASLELGAHEGVVELCGLRDDGQLAEEGAVEEREKGKGEGSRQERVALPS